MLSAERRQEIADFLKTRRMRRQPEELGLPRGRRRRTPGLRREEVADGGVAQHPGVEDGHERANHLVPPELVEQAEPHAPRTSASSARLLTPSLS